MSKLQREVRSWLHWIYKEETDCMLQSLCKPSLPLCSPLPVA